ncbi:MAG: hypothetical protein JW860_02495 [Sedimentisphaerales bacterium]|nr:hypothetical protein [Sedimentisphaerales bacterium]
MVGAGNVIGNFITMPVPQTGADTYLEVGFSSSAGSIRIVCVNTL